MVDIIQHFDHRSVIGNLCALTGLRKWRDSYIYFSFRDISLIFLNIGGYFVSSIKELASYKSFHMVAM